MKIHSRNEAQRTGRIGPPALSACLASSIAAAAFGADMPVSPGGLVEISPVSSACPTFSWSTDSTSGIELVVASYLAPETTMLQQELPAGATSWTPPANRCLPPGQYVWFFRDLDSTNAEWSDALGFEVGSAPTLDEVERARNVLERFISHGGATADRPALAAGSLSGQSSSASTSAVPAGGEVPRASSRALSGNKTIATGNSPAATISSAAVSGISDFPDVAGALAGNTADGVDLVLEGAVQGQVKENEWKLDSAAAQNFDFLNPSGNLTLRVNGNPVLTSASTGAGEPISMFGTFGGHGIDDKTVAGTEFFDKPIAYFRNLTIPAGTMLVVTQPIAFIAVSGTCDIAGEIRTTGSGQAGGSRATDGPAPGYPGTNAAGAGSGYGMHGGMHRVAIPMAIAGAGGGGGGTGNAPLQRGGDGGGGEARGGEGGYAQDGTLNGRAASVDWNKRHLMTGGATDNIQFPPGLLRTDFFINFLYFPGAGGGGGAVGAVSSVGGKGGYGGGNIYLECRSARFTGVMNVSGTRGEDASGVKAGGGGGGGGGIGVIRTLDLIQNTGSVQVAGGLGGRGIGGGGAGGNGRMGLVEIVEL